MGSRDGIPSESGETTLRLGRNSKLVCCGSLALPGATVACFNALDRYDAALQIGNLPWSPFVARRAERNAERNITDRVFGPRGFLFRTCRGQAPVQHRLVLRELGAGQISVKARIVVRGLDVLG